MSTTPRRLADHDRNVVPLTRHQQLGIERLAHAAAADTAVEYQQRLTRIELAVLAYDRREIDIYAMLNRIRLEVAEL